MGTIDYILFNRVGARGCDNSDYNLAITTCCNSYIVIDSELDDIYYDASNLQKVLGIDNHHKCPICKEIDWNYTIFDQWPKKQTAWMKFYHPNFDIINNWLNS